MANLLQKASIVLTPTAYDNGKVLCAKPSESPYGDFDFSRNSAATRVNAQGLVENVQILSSNLVQNGDFSEEGVQEVSNGSFSQEGVELVTNGSFDTDSDWTKGTGWTISEGSASFDGTTSNSIRQNIGLVENNIYKVTFTISNVSQGGVAPVFGGSLQLQTITANGTYTMYSKSGLNPLLYFQPVSNFIGSINNVSVREVGQDWTLGTGWSIGEDKAISDGLSNFENIYQTISPNLVIGNSYLISFDLIVTSGALRIRTNAGTYYSNVFNTSGNQSVTLKLENGSDFWFNSYSGFEGSITNISIKEVGQNWTLGGTAAIGDNLVNINSPSGENAEVYQSSVLVIGRKYKLDCTLNKTSGDTQFVNGGTFILNNGSNVIQFTATDTRVYFKRGAGSVISSITNISVIEITDDTNLPRINYEGFSYQDALGSEEIVNGDFSNGANNWTLGTGWSVSDGKAVAGSLSNGADIRQVGIFQQSKKYKISIDADKISGTNIILRTYNGSFQTIGDLTENSSFIYTTTATNNGTLYIVSNNFIGSIDNVSVKEYLGQEVVPDSGCGSWLWEPQSTNLITQSELFSDASWVKSRSTYTSDAIKSPSGLINMGYLTEDTTATNTHYMRTFLTLTDGVDYTLSVFAKAKERNIICLGDNAAAQSNTGVWFDLTNGVVLTQRSGYVGSIKDFGNGIYRCSVIYSAAAARQYADIAISLSDGVNVYTGDGTSGVYIWGAQLEQQTYATSYIPTSGSTVTRNQDVCTNGGSLASINSTEGTLYFEGAALADTITDRYMISISDGTTLNSVFIRFGNASNLIEGRSRIGGANVGITNFVVSDETEFHKIAYKWKLNDYALWVDGVEVGTSTGVVASANTFNTLNFDSGAGGQIAEGKTKAVAVWKEALSDEELADLTYPTPTDPTFALDFDTIATDFTFARGSEATYVDAQGLIQSTNELGPELITNGDFSNGIPIGTNGSGWLGFVQDSNTIEYANGGVKLTVLGISASECKLYARTAAGSSVILTVGKQYKVTYTVLENNGVSNFTYYIGGSYQQVPKTVGTHTYYFTQSVNGLSVFRNSSLNSDITLDNVSIKEVITATNTPRLDYSTGAEAFLLEPQSTNLVTSSEDFSNSAWAKIGTSTLGANAGTSPSGGVDAYSLIPETLNERHLLRDGFTATSIDVTGSFFVKPNGYNHISMSIIYSANSAGAGVIVDLTDGSTYASKAQSGASFSVKVDDYVDGWKRVSLSVTQSANASDTFNIGAFDGGAVVWNNGSIAPLFAGNGTDGVLIYGAQVEALPYATSYIPTSGSTVTRNQETCINATPEINSEEGVLYFEGAILGNDGTYKIVSLSDGTTLNVVRFYYSVTDNRIVGNVKSGGGIVFDFNHVLQDSTDFLKTAISYRLNDFKMYVNGTKVASDTAGNAPIGLNVLTFNNGGGASPFFGNTKDVQVYTKALSDAELIKLTT